MGFPDRCPPPAVYPELKGQMDRTRLVVLAGEVGGWWSEECREFLRPRPVESPGICARDLARCGGTGRRLSWLAARPKLLPSRCWSAGAGWDPMVTILSPPR